MAVKVAAGEDEEPIEGYTIVVGGGFADRGRIGRELWRDVPFAACAGKIEGLLRAYLATRANPDESFQAFADRHEPGFAQNPRGGAMTAQVPPPRMLVPPGAPFSPEQQAWLNGFFAAVLSTDGAPAPLSAADNAALAPPAAELADNDSAPWHDPSLPIDERMAMAQSRPAAPRLMAAMAQQDCGQCGYNCADYANALFLKKEERLTLCAPGGKETARMLKQLAAEIGPTVAAPAVADRAGERHGAVRGRQPVARQSWRGKVPVASSPQRRRFGQDHVAC